MSYEIRPIRADEVLAFRSAITLGFGGDAKERDNERFMTLMPLERTVAVFDGDEIIGNLGDFPLELTVPGGAQLVMASMTMVGVRADHTRKGILSSMVTTYLDKAVERGDPIAGLWASEPGIYGRFGFGVATEGHDVKIDTRHLQVAPPSEAVRVSMIPASSLLEVVAPFWSRVADHYAGFIERTTERWQDLAVDPEHRRGTGSALRHVVAMRDDEVVGYLAYRQSDKWIDFVADGSINIQVLIGEDSEAHKALWHYATSIDLFPHVSFWDGAIDDPLAYQASNARSVQRKMVDGLYVRILNAEATLAARTYETDGEVVIAVADDLGYAAGTFRLTVRGGVGEVSRVDVNPDVSLNVRELSAMYLGRVCVDQLTRMGLIAGDEAAVRQLGQLFVTARAPWCPEMF